METYATMILVTTETGRTARTAGAGAAAAVIRESDKDGYRYPRQLDYNSAYQALRSAAQL